MKSNDVNSPGSSCMAKIILCTFHCNLSSIFNSLNKFIMFGYAPKKMCNPVSIQSPSLSCHALTFPPNTSLASNTIGSCPASARYFAHANPLNPPPTMATRFFSVPLAFRSVVNRFDSSPAMR